MTFLLVCPHCSQPFVEPLERVAVPDQPDVYRCGSCRVFLVITCREINDAESYAIAQHMFGLKTD